MTIQMPATTLFLTKSCAGLFQPTQKRWAEQEGPPCVPVITPVPQLYLVMMPGRWTLYQDLDS